MEIKEFKARYNKWENLVAPFDKEAEELLHSLTLKDVEDANLFYTLIGRYGCFYAYSQSVAVDISYKNIKGNSSVCCVQVCQFKDGKLMITHGWDAARPHFGELLHKENEYYFSKIDFVDSKKFQKVDKPFGYLS